MGLVGSHLLPHQPGASVDLPGAASSPDSSLGPPPSPSRLLELAHALEAALATLLASSSGGADRAAAAAASAHGCAEQVRLLTSTCRRLCFNLADPKNPDLRMRLHRGELTPHALVRMSSKELASGALREQRAEWHRRRTREAEWEAAAHAADGAELIQVIDAYKCEVCLRVGTCAGECRRAKFAR